MVTTPALQVRKAKKAVAVVGATGMVGRELLRQLATATAYERVYVLARSPPPELHGLDRYTHVDIGELSRAADPVTQALRCDPLPPGHDFVSCLGTTRAKAGSAAEFERVDYALNLGFAQLAARSGYQQYALVSAMGADADSLLVYPRVKGQLERSVKGIPFWSTHIFHPGILTGDRREPRLLEEVTGRLLSGARTLLGRGFPARYAPTSATVLSRAIRSSLQRTAGGIFTYPNERIHELARQSAPS